MGCGFGTVFKITLDGMLTTVHHFDRPVDGALILKPAWYRAATATSTALRQAVGPANA